MTTARAIAYLPLTGIDSDHPVISKESAEYHPIIEIIREHLIDHHDDIQSLKLIGGSIHIDYHSGRSQTIEDKLIIAAVKRIQYAEIEKRHSGDNHPLGRSYIPTVNTCLDKVIPVSDTLAIYRNVFKLMISAVALMLVVLSSIAGIDSSSILYIGLGITAVSLIVLYALYKYKLISKEDAQRLFFMTIMTLLGTFVGGKFLGYDQMNYVLIAIYSLSVIVQGFLFAVPQGLIGWGKGSRDKQEIAREANDAKHMTSGLWGQFSGFLSSMEGSTWMFMGTLMLTAALAPIIPGVPAFLPEVLPYVVAGLFFGIFNISYISMIYTALRDKKILEKFHTNLAAKFNGNTREGCIAALEFLKHKLLGKDEKWSDDQYLLKKLNRLRRVMDADAFDLLRIENIEILLKGLKLENQKALDISQMLIQDILQANERSIEIANKQWKIGLAGLFIGTFVSLLEELVNPGSVIEIPYLGDYVSLSPEIMNIFSQLATMIDCGFWAYINHCYKEYLDAPPGRNDLENESLKEIHLKINSFLENANKDLRFQRDISRHLLGSIDPLNRIRNRYYGKLCKIGLSESVFSLTER